MQIGCQSHGVKLLKRNPRAQAWYPGWVKKGLSPNVGAIVHATLGIRHGMKLQARLLPIALVFAFSTGCSAQKPSEASRYVVSSDPELAKLAAEVLPDVARRSGLSLREPVRFETRSVEELQSYLRFKLQEELPPAEARARTDVYAFLGLLEPEIDLHELLMGLYTEQVAGFYEPDSTAFFLIEGQGGDALVPLLVHELVHAVQDQAVDLSALSDPDQGNDQATAAMAAIEGQATLVMFEYLAEQMSGGPVDLATVGDFANQIRPALEMTAQFPALASAPRIIRESLLFPYVDGAIYMQRLWTREGRDKAFAESIPTSTEQVLSAGADAPIFLRSSTDRGEVLLSDQLGVLELRILMEDVLGHTPTEAGVPGWDGDLYALVSAEGEQGLAYATLWSTASERDAFAALVEGSSDNFGDAVAVERVTIGNAPATVLRIGEAASTVRFDIR